MIELQMQMLKPSCPKLKLAKRSLEASLFKVVQNSISDLRGILTLEIRVPLQNIFT